METLLFLQRYFLEPFKFVPGKPLLYIFPQNILGKDKPLGQFPQHIRPNIVRVNSPITLAKPHRNGLSILICEGQLDFYSIDSQTQKITLVKTSTEGGVFSVEETSLFNADDKMFPRGQKTET